MHCSKLVLIVPGLFIDITKANAGIMPRITISLRTHQTLPVPTQAMRLHLPQVMAILLQCPVLSLVNQDRLPQPEITTTMIDRINLTRELLQTPIPLLEGQITTHTLRQAQVLSLEYQDRLPQPEVLTTTILQTESTRGLQLTPTPLLDGQMT